MNIFTGAGMSNVHRYTIVIRPDGGTFVAYVPAIPGCHAVGRTMLTRLDEAEQSGNSFEM